MRLEAVLTLVLYVTSLEVTTTEAAPRKRGKKYRTSSTYLDSYQYPGRNRDLDEFSGDDSDDDNERETFPDVYYGQDSVYGRNNYGGGLPNNYGGNFYGSRFDFEGSGSSPDEADEEEEGSGYGTLTDDEDIFRITTTPKATTTTTIFYQTTSAASQEEEEDFYEGSGSGDFDNDDEWEAEEEHSIPRITVPSRAPTTPSTTLDFEFEDKFTTETSTVKVTTERTTILTTQPTTPTTSTTVEQTTPSTTQPKRPITKPTERIPSLWPTPPSTARPTRPTTSTTSSTTTTESITPNRRPTFPIPTVPPKIYGPDREKVPTPGWENRVVIIIAYTSSILLLLIVILIVLCMLMRYHKRAPSEVSSDTASSDLPMLKPDAKRYNPGIIRRQNSESPPPLPDLNLFDEPPKYSDLVRGGRSGGSLRKSKPDLKHSTPPNWL